MSCAELVSRFIRGGEVRVLGLRVLFRCRSRLSLLLVVLMSRLPVLGSGNRPRRGYECRERCEECFHIGKATVTPGPDGRGRGADVQTRRQHRAAFDFYLLTFPVSRNSVRPTGSSRVRRGLGVVVTRTMAADASGDYPRIAATHRGPRIRKPTRNIIPNVSLVEHEWQTTAPVSGLEADAYFAAARSAFTGLKILPISHRWRCQRGYPCTIAGTFAKSNAAYPAGSIALSCGNNRLTAIEVCLRKDCNREVARGAVMPGKRDQGDSAIDSGAILRVERIRDNRVRDGHLRILIRQH